MASVVRYDTQLVVFFVVLSFIHVVALELGSCLNSEVCTGKCCSTEQYFDAASGGCRILKLGKENHEKMVLCCNDQWLNSVALQSTSNIECIDDVLNKDDLERKTFLCPSNSEPCNASTWVRKCCPIGSGMNLITKTCDELSDDRKIFEIVFHDQNRSLERVDSFAVHDGSQPKCVNRRILLNPSEDPGDDFLILPSGLLYIPFINDSVDDYCVDDFIVDHRIERKALICDDKEAAHRSDAENWIFRIYPYLMFGSSTFLVATVTVYAILPEIRNANGLLVMCHSGSLAVTYIGLGVIQLIPDMNFGSCVALAVIVHFSFLSAFMWLNVMSLDIWMAFSNPRPTLSPSPRMIEMRWKRFVFYSIYAWGIPFVFVAVGQILDHFAEETSLLIRPQFGRSKCWFEDRTSILVYLYAPVAIMLLTNVVFYVLTAVRLYRHHVESSSVTNVNRRKQMYIVTLTLFIVMGLTWVTEVVTWSIGDSTFYSIPTDVLNILTGVFIFVTYVCKRKVFRLVAHKFRKRFSLEISPRQRNQPGTVDVKVSSM